MVCEVDLLLKPLLNTISRIILFFREKGKELSKNAPRSLMTLASAFWASSLCSALFQVSPSHHLRSREYRWERLRHGKITLCAQVPTASRWMSQHLPSDSSALQAVFTTRRWHFLLGASPNVLRVPQWFLPLITLLFKYLSPLPRTAEFQLQTFKPFIFRPGAVNNKAVSEILSRWICFSNFLWHLFQCFSENCSKVYSLREEETECLPCPCAAYMY